jgi:hypothetical protein
MAVHLDQRDAIDSLTVEKLDAERKLGERTREMLTAMARDRDPAPSAANGVSR